MNRNQDVEFMSQSVPVTNPGDLTKSYVGAFDKAFQEAIDVVNPRRFANFLLEQAELSTTPPERKAVLRDLAKMVVHEADASAKAHLAAPSAFRFKTSGQPAQKNARAAQSGIAVVLRREQSPGDSARHSRYCQDSNGNDVQGRNCSICLGEGFHSFAKRMAKLQNEDE